MLTLFSSNMYSTQVQRHCDTIWCNLGPMNTPLHAIESEFASAEDAAAHDRWFRDQVQAALDDSRPSVPHDQVMAEMRALIASKRRKNKPTNAS